MGYRQAFRKAFPYTIPVLTGYLFIGIAFGVMFAEKGYSFLWAVLMSLLVYAGSGQYLAVNLFAPGVSLLQVVFLTLMVNIRHIFYGISLLEKFHSMGPVSYTHLGVPGRCGKSPGKEQGGAVGRREKKRSILRTLQNTVIIHRQRRVSRQLPSFMKKARQDQEIGEEHERFGTVPGTAGSLR